MLRYPKSGLLLLLAIVVLLGRPAVAVEGIRGKLVSVEWLEKNLQRPDLLVLDASPAQLYKVQHIPGANNVDLFSYGVGRCQSPNWRSASAPGASALARRP